MPAGIPETRAEGDVKGGYGTVAHRSPPDGREVAATEARRAVSWRAISVWSVLLAAATLIVAVAVTETGAPAGDLASAPMLLSNRADFSDMAKEAADSMISADEQGAARTTALASVKARFEELPGPPLAIPFPDIKWNVFDPGDKSPPHHRWSKRRLREEAARLDSLVTEAEHWEDKKYHSDLRVSQKSRSWLNESLGNTMKIEDEAKAHMVTVYQGLKVIETSLGKAIGTTAGMELPLEKEEDKKKRGVWEILEEHKGKLDYNKALQEQHDLLMKADIYKQDNLDTVKVNRNNERLTADQDRVSGWIEGLRGRIGINMSAFKQTSIESLYRLGNFSADEQKHADNAYESATNLRTAVLNTAHEIAEYGRIITTSEQNVSASKQDIKAQTATAQYVTKGADSLEVSMNTSCCSSASECQATMRTLDSKFEDTKQRLVTVMESMRTVQSVMEEQQAAHSALVQHEDAEMKKLKDASSDLEPQIKSILDLSSTIAGLKGEAAKGIGILTTHLSALDAEKSMTAVEEEKFLTDLANLRKAVNEQQTYADDDNTKADYADLEAAVVSMESKIAMVHELKNDLSTIEGTMTESSQNITSQIVALEVGRKTWEDETTVLHKDLSTKVVAEISRQQGDITATQEALKMLADKIKTAKDFKQHMMDVHSQLRQELADTTQSLVALNQRFSDLYAALEKKLADTQTAADQMALPEETKVASDRVNIKAQQSLNSVTDVANDVEHLKATEKDEKTKLEGLQQKLKSVKRDSDEALKNAKNLLERHPNLLQRISCVCYDGDVLKGKCIAGSLADTSTCDICPEGSWCVRGVALPCKTSCPGGQVLKGKCPAGSITDVTTCEPSPEGFYSTNGVALACRTTCGAGDELRGSCPAGSLADTTRCTPCPAGFFCQKGVASQCKTTCDDGYVLTGKCIRGEPKDATTCQPSPAGYYGSGGAAIPCQTTCPDGKYLIDECPAGSTQDTSMCVSCPDGHFCHGGKAFKCKETCADGEELTGQCPSGSVEDVTVCTRCPEGNFCKGGQVFECRKSCPAGQELQGRCRKGSTTDTTQCKDCKADFFCINGVSTACKQDCPSGLTLTGKCEARSATDITVCKPCPENFFCDSALRVTECKSRCWSGKILNGKCGEGSTGDTTTCDECPANYYCLAGIAYGCKTQCGDGALLTGVCEKGSYQDTTRCDPCPAKSFCKGGKQEPCKTTCPDGQLLKGFCKAGSASDSTECVPCPEGSHCVDGKAQECLKTCPNGQVLRGKCVEGSSSAMTTCEVCPAGSFCRDGKEQKCRTTCPAGKYLDGTCEEGGSRDQTQCKDCQEDSFCVDGKMQTCKETCPGGKVLKGECKAGSESDKTTCDPCPAGSFCSDGLVFPCKTTCPLGEQLTGQCSAGSESDTTKCQPCPEGYFCRDGVATACRTSCPDGHKLDTDCPEGSTVNAQCKPCRAGVFCATGREEPCKTTCEAGKVLKGFCPSGSVADVTSCIPAPAGSFAVDGIASLCVSMCPPGQLLTGSCPAGSTKDGMLCAPCPEGQWCVDGVSEPCIKECPDGKMLTGACAEGSQTQTVTCEPCPAGSFCADNQITACKTACADGKFLEGECSVGSAEDNTHCSPSPAGVYCKGGVQTPCRTTCPNGKELIGFCAAGSIEDTTSCSTCPAGYFCKDGQKMLCKTSCDDGELFKGECAEGSVEDTTVCDVCPAGFYCQGGLKKACKTSCPFKTTLLGECIAGSVTDTVQCVSDGTPEPFTILWYKERTRVQAVGVALLGARSDLLGAETRLACPSCGEGFVMGRRRMPLTGAKWLVQWYAAWPAYDKKAAADGKSPTFPVQGYGMQKSDSITATMNGVVIEMPPPSSGGKIQLGQMNYFKYAFEGDELVYRFDFTSQTSDVLARPYIVGGEVTLLHDSTTGNEGSGMSWPKPPPPTAGDPCSDTCTNLPRLTCKQCSKCAYHTQCACIPKDCNCGSDKCIKAGGVPIGAIAGNVENAIDGNKIITQKKWNNGFDKQALVREDPQFLIFNGTKLVTQVPINKAQFTIDLPDGDYTCLATMAAAQAFYDKNCRVGGNELKKDLVFSPVVVPGVIRVVLTWGAAVKDLDAFMLTPHKDFSDPPCEVNWQDKQCSSSTVQLDKDDKNGFGPETITISQIRSEGRYRYRVSEYKGDSDDNSARLQLSEANVAVYSFGEYVEYQVGIDGFIKGNNWYVFTIDSKGKIQPCNKDTCGRGNGDNEESAISARR